MKQNKETVAKSNTVENAQNVQVDYANASVDVLKSGAQHRAADLAQSSHRKGGISADEALRKALINECYKGSRAAMAFNAIVARMVGYIKSAEPYCYHLVVRNKARMNELTKSFYPMHIHTTKEIDGKTVDFYYPCRYAEVAGLEDAAKKYGLIDLDKNESLKGFSFLSSGCGDVEVVETSDTGALLHKAIREEVAVEVVGNTEIRERDENGKLKKRTMVRSFYPVLLDGKSKTAPHANEGRLIYEAFAKAVSVLVWEQDDTEKEKTSAKKSSKKSSKKSK